MRNTDRAQRKPPPWTTNVLKSPSGFQLFWPGAEGTQKVKLTLLQAAAHRAVLGCCNGGGSSSEGRGSAHPTLPATLEKIGGLLPLFAYLSEINFLGDIISELVRYLKYKVICEFVCENLWGEVPGIMTSCLLNSFEISLIYIKLKKKRLKA